MSPDDRGTLPFWSIPFGTIGGLRVRISCLFLLLPIVFCTWYGFGLGAAVSATIFVSAVVHEAGRLIAAMAQHADLKLVLLWPAGGLAPAQRVGGRRSMSLHFGGLVGNALVCAALAWPLWANDALFRALDLSAIASLHTSQSVGSVDALVLIFAVNWGMVLVNLIPLVPFDTGYVVENALHRWCGEHTAAVVTRRIGWVIATLLLVGGLATETLLLIALAGFAMVSLMYRHVPEPEFETEAERFLGYDFSEGYTSLDRSTPEEETPPAPGLFERWRIHREHLRRVREAQFDREVNEKLDQILAKVHASGMNSLTPHEQQLLQRASTRYRERGTSLSE